MTPSVEQLILDEIREIKAAIHGNGNPGLVARMVRLETEIGLLRWIGGAAAGAAIISAVSAVTATVLGA